MNKERTTATGYKSQVGYLVQVTLSKANSFHTQGKKEILPNKTPQKPKETQIMKILKGMKLASRRFYGTIELLFFEEIQ